MDAAVNMAPWIGVIGSLIGWTFFLIILGMFKGFIVSAFSMYVAELIYKISDDTKRGQLIKYLTDSEMVVEYLKEINKRETV